MSSDKTLSPTEFLNKVKGLLEGTFNYVRIKGEVINLTSSANGHYYFSITDQNSTISIAVFRGDALRNPLMRQLKNGDEVIISGPIGVYTKRGTFQLIGKSVEKVGKGDLKEQFELLKSRLAAEGLFSIEHKQEIPRLPEKIAVITSPRGAALQDFLNVFKNRSHWMDVTLIPAIVQGKGCAESVVNALHKAIKKGEYDVIVITRGGGSIEDLWGFNDEGLAYEIYNCPIPIISAVGHEVDFTICDFVADQRVETPTAAANFLTEGQLELVRRLSQSKKNLKYSMEAKVFAVKHVLSDFSPKNLINIFNTKLNMLNRWIERLNIFKNIYETLGIYENYYILDDLAKRMSVAISDKVKDFKNFNNKNYELLNAYNPKNILRRGYSYIESDKKIIRNKKDFKKLKEGSPFIINFHDGIVEVEK